MFAVLVKTLLLLTTFNVSVWQNSLHDDLVKKLSYPSFPVTYLHNLDENSLTFFSYAAVKDPGEKYYYVMHDVASVPTWLFIMRHDNKLKDELWHRENHFGVPCNVLRGNKLLLHIKTVGFIKTDIIFRVRYEVENTKYGVIVYAEIDKSFPSSKVIEFKMLLWAFPHPAIKNLVIVVSQGYIKTSYSIDMLNNHIKWHIDNVLQNFGDRLMAVMQ